jgi:hypothetical protein
MVPRHRGTRFLLDSRLTDSGEVVCLTHQPTAGDSWYSFLRSLVDPKAIVRLEGLG